MSRIAVAGLLALAAPLATAAPSAAQSFTRGASVSVENAYVFRGIQRAEWAAFADANLVVGPFYGGGLLVAPFGDDTDELPVETRLYAGFQPDVVLGLASFDFGAVLYAFPEGSSVFEDDERLEAYGGIALNLPLQPSAKVYYDTELEVFSVIGSLAQYVGIAGTTGLDLALSAGAIEPDEGESYQYLQGSVDVVHGLGRGLEGFVGVRAAVASEDTFFDDLTEVGPTFGEAGTVWGGAGLRVSF